MKSDGGQGKPRFGSDHPTTGMLADWREQAACRTNPDFGQLSVRDAKAVCCTCPVALDCLRWALALRPADDPGHVWGGTSESERVVLRRKRSKNTTPRPQYPDGWSKECPDCEQELLADEFGVDGQRRDGLRRYCRACTAKRLRAYKQALKEAM